MFLKSFRTWILALLCAASVSQAAFVAFHDGFHAGDHLSAATSQAQELRADMLDCACQALHAPINFQSAPPAISGLAPISRLEADTTKNAPEFPFLRHSDARAPPSA